MEITYTKDFDNFYTEKLLPKMQRLKAEQKTVDKWGFIGIGAVVISAVILFFGLEYDLKNFGIPVGIGAAIAIFSYIMYVKKNDIFVDDFKGSVIKEIIEHVYPGIIYKPENCVPEKDYRTSKLFRAYYDGYYGEDYMQGVYKNVSFHCSELETLNENNRTIFKGMFFTAKINGAFNGGTYIWDRDFEQLPASIMDEEYRLMPMPDVVRVTSANPSFNQCFSICTTSTHQAQQILSAERLQRIINLKARLRANMALSFAAGHCYVALAAYQDLLDPSEYQPDDKEQISVYYYTVTTILDLIDELKLYELV